jgi:hypothetical protein
MMDLLLPTGLLVSIVTLAITIGTLRSSRRSEGLGEDRYELLRDQRDRLDMLREEPQGVTVSVDAHLFPSFFPEGAGKHGAVRGDVHALRVHLHPLVASMAEGAAYSRRVGPDVRLWLWLHAALTVGRETRGDNDDRHTESSS